MTTVKTDMQRVIAKSGPLPPPPPDHGITEQEAVARLRQGVKLEDLRDNKDLAKAIGALKDNPDPTIRNKLHETIKALVTHSLQQNLQGKSGEEGVKAALDGVTKDAIEVAKLMHAGSLVTATAADVLKTHKDDIKTAVRSNEGSFHHGIDNLVDASAENLSLAGQAVDMSATQGANLLAEKAMGPQKMGFVDQVPGLTGAVTNRLGIGDGALLSVGGEATLPTETVATLLSAGLGGEAVPNLSGEFKGAMMLSRDEQGKINLTLTVEGKVGVQWQGGVKAGVSVEADDMRAGWEVGADGAVGASHGQAMEVTLKFDPKNPDDVARLRNLIEPHGSDVLGMASIALSHGAALKDAISHNFNKIEVGQEFSANAGFSLHAEAGILEPKPEKGDTGHKEETKKEGAKTGKEEESPRLAVKGEVGVDASAALSTSVAVDREHNVETKVLLKGGGSVHAGLSGLGHGVNGAAGKEKAWAFIVKHDAHGKVTSLEAESTVKGTASSSLDGNSRASANSNTVNHHLTEAGMDQARTLIKQGATPFAAFRRVAKQPGMLEADSKSIQGTTHHVGIEADATLGVGKVKLGASAEIGLSHTEAKKISPNLQDLATLLGD